MTQSSSSTSIEGSGRSWTSDSDSPDDPPHEPGRDGRTDPFDDGPGPVIELVIHCPEPDPPISGWIEPALVKIAMLAGVEGGTVSLAVVPDDQMADLHERYRGESGTTDVLTFDLSDSALDGRGPPDESPAAVPRMLDGEIVICLDEAARQAARYGHDVRLEALLYAVHGLLHLLGYRDHDDAHATEMHRREDELLIAAGIGPIYQSEHRPGSPGPIGG